jgi:hypothetical protein
MRRYSLFLFVTSLFSFTNTSCVLEARGLFSNSFVCGFDAPYLIPSLDTSVFSINKVNIGDRVLLDKITDTDTVCTLNTAIKIIKDVDCYAASNATLVAVSTEDIGTSYKWSNGVEKSVISNLAANRYSVTVTNALGCKATDSIILANPTPLSVEVKELLGITCHGKKDALLDVTIKGGRPPYSYQWSTGATTQQLKKIGAGLYTVRVHDSNKCTAKDQFKLENPDSLMVHITSVDTGMLEAVEVGGQLPYTYQWSVNANSETTKIISGLNPDLYSVTVTDAFGCYSKASFTLNIRDVFNLERLDSNLIWPNPNKGVVHILLADIYERELSWRLINTVGKMVQKGTLEVNKQKYQINLHRGLLNGYYYFVFDDTIKKSYLKLRVTR